ncbi:acyl carrier protein [Devosia sp. A16]|uniref:acyl carrier protein n=1 Tax=Devosia sp. A16 TaxID=1736675 RepID=UPI0006D83DB7|nr:acyl carrier protein [Devosia sp. A16]
MTEREIRQMLVDAMLGASVFGLRDNGWTDEFVAGTRDVAMGDLEMDSLGAMELCIAVEVNTGVEIVPDQLATMPTLGTLVGAIQRDIA